jgi:hypothetical protein
MAMREARVESGRVEPAWSNGEPATVAELSQVPGARQALADYIGILQEWSSRADEDGAAP